MKKILLGMGYLTWMICNIAVIYWIGRGVMVLIEAESVGTFLFNLAGGLIGLMLVVVLSILCLGLVASMFGDDKVIDKIHKIFPFLDI